MPLPVLVRRSEAFISVDWKLGVKVLKGTVWNLESVFSRVWPCGVPIDRSIDRSYNTDRSYCIIIIILFATRLRRRAVSLLACFHFLS